MPTKKDAKEQNQILEVSSNGGSELQRALEQSYIDENKRLSDIKMQEQNSAANMHGPSAFETQFSAVNESIEKNVLFEITKEKPVENP